MIEFHKESPKANKTDAGNGSKAICRVSNVHWSLSTSPKLVDHFCNPQLNTIDSMNSYTGIVNGIDVIAHLDEPTETLAFINGPTSEIATQGYIQVRTAIDALAAALFAASVKQSKVEVSFSTSGGFHKLTRVRTLDRD